MWKGEFKTDVVLAKLPLFQMKNQNEKNVSEASVHGHITVMNFFYASCGSICPMLMSRTSFLPMLKNAGESVHSENVYILDQKGLVRGIYNASSEADLELLVGDVRSLVGSK